MTSITVPGDSRSGQPVQVSWTAENTSNETASGRWSDAVFLSADASWDIFDAPMGRVEFNGTVAPGQGQFPARHTAAGRAKADAAIDAQPSMVSSFQGSARVEQQTAEADKQYLLFAQPAIYRDLACLGGRLFLLFYMEVQQGCTGEVQDDSAEGEDVVFHADLLDFLG